MKSSRTIALALAAPLLVSVPGRAVNAFRVVSTPGARLCTLSVPTNDTRVRPKATGFRNEGTTNAFVICAFDSAPGQTGVVAEESEFDPLAVVLNVATIDGAAHSFDCTGVNSQQWPPGSGGLPMQYVAKTMVIDPASPSFPTAAQVWEETDFGGVANIPTEGAFSITCLLPPGAAILSGEIYAWEDVGS